MKDNTDFNLIFDVINEVIIISKENNIIFIGDQIKETLFNKEDKLEKNLLENIPDKNLRNQIKKKIDLLLSENNIQKLELKDINKKLYFYSTKYNKTKNIIITTNKKVFQASKIEYNLKERVKELECLYNISSVFESTKNIEEAFEKSINYLIEGFQFPEHTTAEIEIKGKVFGNLKCKKQNVLSENIIINDQIRGKIKVCYDNNALFLKEERKLLKTISIVISKAYGKIEKTIDLEKQKMLLGKKNVKLIKMTEICNENRKKLETLFNAITDTIFVIDSNLNIEMSNKSDVGNYGKCYKKVFNKDSVCEDCPSIETFKTKKPAVKEKKILNQYYLINSYPILNDNGEVDKVFGICNNITKEKQLEYQLLQTDRLTSLGKLVSGIAHEINNPNTFILGNIKIVKEVFEEILPILDEYAKSKKNLKIARLDYNVLKENILILINDMLKGADRIKKIVDDLKNFARRDDGLLIDEVDINEIIKSSVRLVENQLKHYVRINLYLNADLPKFKGNIRKLEQVIVNMLLNSYQAIDDKNSEITIETDFNNKLKEIIIKISDKGEGIDEDTIKSIFDPFFTTKRSKGGTGLGLSIVYGLVKEHNGRIQVDSKLGIGSVFTIFIPI